MSNKTNTNSNESSRAMRSFKTAMNILVVILLFIVVVLVSTSVLSISIPIWFAVFVLFLTVASVFGLSVTFSKLGNSITSDDKSDEQ